MEYSSKINSMKETEVTVKFYSPQLQRTSKYIKKKNQKSQSKKTAETQIKISSERFLEIDHDKTSQSHHNLENSSSENLREFSSFNENVIQPNQSEQENDNVQEKSTTYSNVSITSLEFECCKEKTEDFLKEVFEEIGPYEKNLDLLKIFIDIMMEKGNICFGDLEGIFLTEDSGFYDYYYLRKMENYFLLKE